MSGTVNITAGTRQEAPAQAANAVNAQELLAKYKTTLTGGLNQYGKDILAGKVEEKHEEGELTHL